MNTFENSINIVYNIHVFFDRFIGSMCMSKECCYCGLNKGIELFYKRHKSCKECWNAARRNAYKKSICRNCDEEFRPGVEGRYKFCSEKCRFMNKVSIDQVSGCWMWQGELNKTGYGKFVPIGKRNGLAHRSSYRLFKGELPTDSLKFILHSCHKPSCVAPDHLRIGTPIENTEDRRKAGRTTNHGHKKNQRN